MSGSVSISPQAVVTTSGDDLLERDGRVLVLIGSEVMLLSQIASAIVIAARGGIGVEGLTNSLVESFGVPDGGAALTAVEHLLAELVARGVIQLD